MVYCKPFTCGKSNLTMNFYDELKYKVLGGDPLNSCVIRGRRKDVHRPIDPGTFLG